MNMNRLGGCIFTIAIILLSSFSSVVSLSDKNNEQCLDYAVKFIGLDYVNTIHLTNNEVNMIKSRINDFRNELSHVSTIAQAKEVYAKMIDDLDQYGLFGKISTEKTLRFILSDMIYSPSNIINNYISAGQTVENKSNFLCFVAGSTENTFFESNIARMITKPAYYLLELLKYTEENNLTILHKLSVLLSAPLFFILFYSILSYYNHVPVGYTIGLGLRSLSDTYPANGWITTVGLNGIKSWVGSFYGQLKRIPILIILFDGGIFYPGVSGFTGIQVSEIGSMDCFYFGTALQVKIGPEVPYDYYPFQ